MCVRMRCLFLVGNLWIVEVDRNGLFPPVSCAVFASVRCLWTTQNCYFQSTSADAQMLITVRALFLITM
jgi:hypothetical protein